jgi:hypothetical protein
MSITISRKERDIMTSINIEVHKKALTIKTNRAVEKIIRSMGPRVSEEERLKNLAIALADLGLIPTTPVKPTPYEWVPADRGKYKPGIYQIKDRDSRKMAIEAFERFFSVTMQDAIQQADLMDRHRKFLEKEFWGLEGKTYTKGYKSNLRYETLGRLTQPIVKAAEEWLAYNRGLAADYIFELAAENSGVVDRLERDRRGGYKTRVDV